MITSKRMLRLHRVPALCFR